MIVRGRRLSGDPLLGGNLAMRIARPFATDLFRKLLPDSHVFTGEIDRIHCQEHAAAPVDQRETARNRVAAFLNLVVARGAAGALKLVLILIRPEPRDLIVSTSLADHVRGRGRCLTNGILDGFQAQPTRERGVPVSGAIAGREYVGVRGPAVRVDDDAVVAVQPRIPGELHIRFRADADESDMSFDVAVFADQGFETLATREFAHLSRTSNGYSSCEVSSGEELGDRWGSHAAQDSRLPFQHRNLGTDRPCNGGDLQADITASNDGDASAILNLCAKSERVLHAVEIVHVGATAARKVQRPGPAARGEQQPIVRDSGGSVDPDAPFPAIDTIDLRMQLELYVVRRVKGKGPQIQTVHAQCALQESLRQRRSLVRRLRFVAQQDDAPGESLFPQSESGLRAGLAGTDDHDRSRRLRGSRGRHHHWVTNLASLPVEP